ncbi:MAG: oligosaccharide flippase family protein [Clostridia bacterium]|nr:oligosaccharide flippase family protein [Clostridia bacterium]
MKINQVKFGAFMSYASYGLTVILNLVATPMMIRAFGENEYGVYSLVLPIVSMLTVLTFGLGSVYTRYYTIYKTQNDRDRMARLNGMFITIYSLIGVVAAIIGFSLSMFFEQLFPEVTAEYVPLAKTLMRLMSINMALSFPIYVFTSHIVVHEAYVFQKTLAAIKMVLNPIITIPLVLFGFKSVAVTILTLALTVAVGIADVIYCFKKLRMPVKFGRFEGGVIREMLGFTFFVFISNVVDEINWNSDRIVLGIFRGEVDVGVYAVGAQLNIYFMSLATMLTNVFVPRVHRLVASGRPNRDISDLFIKVGRLQFMLMSFIIVGFIAIGRGFMTYYAGAEYVSMGAFTIALLLMVPTMVPSIQNLGIEIQQAKNKHRFRAITYAIVAVVNVALSIPLCMWLGGVGAALGTVFTVVVGKGILMNWYYYKHVGLDIGRFWKAIGRIAVAFVVPLGAAIAMTLFIPMTDVWVILLCGVGIAALEAVFLWVFGMNNDDRAQLLGPLGRVLKRR